MSEAGHPSRGESLMALEQEVGVLIRRVRRVIGDRARAVHPDLLPSSYLMLTTIQERGPVRASVLAELFDIDKGAISRQVTHLLELGLLRKEPDPDDARAALLFLTDDARSRLDEIVSHRRKWVDDQLVDWTAADLDHLATELGRYNAALTSVDTRETRIG